MPSSANPLGGQSRLAVLLEHFAPIGDPRDVRRIAHPLAEILLLVVCGTLAEQDGLRGALVSIDAVATNGSIAKAIRDAGAGYLLAVEANQPSLRAEVEACFTAAPPGTVDTHTEHDKGRSRIEQRVTSVVREVD